MTPPEDPLVPRDPELGSGGGAPEPPPEPQGIVEELRHEVAELGHAVEEVVEHVPKQVRWTVRKLIGLVALILVGLVVIAIVSALLYFARRTELVAKELTLVINGALAQRSDVQVEIHDISGNPFDRVRLIKPRVYFTDGETPALLEAPWIQLNYSPLQWLRRDRRTIDVVIESPVIRISKGKDGRLRAPVWRSSGSATGGSTALDVNLRVLHGSVAIAAAIDPVSDMDLDAGVSIGASTRGVVRHLRWAQGPFRTRHLELKGSVEKGDTVRIRLDRLHTDDLELKGVAEWLDADSTRIRHVDLEVARLSWRWLSEVTDNHTLDVPGEARGSITASGSRVWTAQFTSSATWKDLPAQASGVARWDHGVVKLEPLHLVSAAGNLAGDLQWSRAGWNIGGAVETADPSRWGAIGITGWPKGVVAGTFRYAVDTHSHAQTANLVATLTTSELQGWRVDGGTVNVEFPNAAPDSFAVNVVRRGGTMLLRAMTTKQGWTGSYRVDNLPLEEWPDGRASGIKGMLGHGEGTVEGKAGALLVTGNLTGTGTSWLGMQAARWALDDASGALLPAPDLAARARLGNVTFLGLHFDSVATPFLLGNQTIALEDLSAFAGDTLVTMAGRSNWNAGAWQLALDRARLRSSQFDWRAEAPVTLAGDARGVTFDRLVARDSLATVTITGRWAVPGGSYDWQARAERLDLSRLGMPPEVHLAGAADATLEVRGAAGDPHWNMAAAVSRPGWDGHAADSLRFELEGRPGAVLVRNGAFRIAAGSVTGSLAFDHLAHAWPDTLTAAGVLRWIEGAGDWNGELTGAALPLDRLRQLVPAAHDWGGTVSGRIGIEGSPVRPVLDATFDASKLTWQAIDIEDVRGHARYAAGQLTVPELHMQRGGRESTASGAMPLVLAMGRPVEVPESPMAWRIDIPNGDLSMARLVVPQIGTAAGKFELRASVTGTPRHPDLDGTLKVSDGVVRMTGRDELFQNVTASVRLDEAKITVDTLTARQGDRGRVTGSGTVELANGGLKGYQFKLGVTEIATTEPGLYAALFDGAFQITDGPVVRGQRLPYVTGNATLRRAVILYDFANVSEQDLVAQTAAPLFWTYNVHLSANNNVHWQPPDGDIEFNLNLDVEQRPEALVLYGEMHALRGKYYFLSNRFDVQNVDLTFDNVSGVNPTLDATAVTQVPVYENGQTHQSQVTVHITGRANEPKIVLSSDEAAWGQAEILQNLTLSRLTAGAAGVPLGDPLDNYITRAINRTFSSEMSRAFRGYINEWQIDRDRGGLFGGEGGVILTAGTQVSPQIALRYRQHLPGLERTPTGPGTSTFLERDLEAEYRLSRFIYLTTEITQHRPGTANVSSTSPPDFNVNLKARWEY